MLAVMGYPDRCWFSVSLFHAQGTDKRDTLYQDKRDTLYQDKRDTLYRSGQIREVPWWMEGTTKHAANIWHTFQMINLIDISYNWLFCTVWRLYCLMKCGVFRHIMLCCEVKVYLKYAALWSYSEDEGSRCLWYIIMVLWSYTLSCPRQQHYSWWLQCKLQISHILCCMHIQLNI